MILYGLIGFPLSHSFSEDYFRNKFEKENLRGKQYQLFPIPDLSRFHFLVKNNPCLQGLNVTIPFKEKIIPFLDELDDKASVIGAVNTIKITRKKNFVCMKGYNTDADGFRLSDCFEGHQDALILGTGGAAKAVAYSFSISGLTPPIAERNHLTSRSFEEPQSCDFATMP